MKTLRITITAITAFLLTGALFFSCELADPDPYGTLIITLPGSGSARALVADGFSKDFLATLRYVVDCTGPGTENRDIGPDGTVTVSLSPGVWTVTITVWDQDELIGTSEPIDVTIEAGKSKTVGNIEVEIKANRNNKITGFSITTGIESFPGVIDDSNNTIVITVPEGTDISNMTFNAVHNGYKISHNPDDTTLNFDEHETYTFSVQPEYGTIRSYTVSVVVTVVEDIWPIPAEWAEYNLTNGLTRPRPEQTTTAYVIDGWDSFNLDTQAQEDLASLPEDISSSIDDRDFLMVKLAFKDADKAAKDDIYRNETTGLYGQIEKNNNFTKKDSINWDNSSSERWDIFEKSNILVNLYMNYSGNYIIILAVKEYSWQKIKWEEYGLDLEQPEDATVVYVTYKPDEANTSTSKLQTVYGLRSFTNTGFPEFFAVVFLDEDGSIFGQLKTTILELELPQPSINNNNRLSIVERKDNYTRAIDLFKPENNKYTIFTVRQGEKTSSSPSAYW